MKCKDVNYELRARQPPFNFKLNRVVTLEETILEFQKKIGPCLQRWKMIQKTHDLKWLIQWWFSFLDLKTSLGGLYNTVPSSGQETYIVSSFSVFQVFMSFSYLQWLWSKKLETLRRSSFWNTVDIRGCLLSSGAARCMNTVWGLFNIKRKCSGYLFLRDLVSCIFFWILNNGDTRWFCPPGL